MTERDPDRGDGRDPIDEEAAWAEIVAGYGEEPADPPGVWPSRGEMDLTDTVDRVTQPADERADQGTGSGDGEAFPEELTGEVSEFNDLDDARFGGERPPGPGPRDWEAAEEDEGHFVPPEPPPLPPTDLTTRLSWVAVLGGPLLLFGGMLLRWEMTWWLATLGIGGFLGGFAALVMRMRDDEDDGEWPDRGSGAVV